MVRHPAAGTEPGLAQRDHSLTLAEVVKSLFYNAFISFTYVGWEGDGTVVTDLLPGFSLLGNRSDGGVFPPVWNHPPSQQRWQEREGGGRERKESHRQTDRQTDRQTETNAEGGREVGGKRERRGEERGVRERDRQTDRQTAGIKPQC